MIFDSISTAVQHNCPYILDSIGWSLFFFVLGYLACWLEVKLHNRRLSHPHRKAE